LGAGLLGLTRCFVIAWTSDARYRKVADSTAGSGVASMEQMEQLLPRAARTTCVIRANPMRYSAGEGGGVNINGICNAIKMCPGH